MSPAPNSHQPWCCNQDANLLSRLEAGDSVENIAASMGRSKLAIMARIFLLAREGHVSITYEVNI